jgi:hypothetical protein
MRTRRCGCGLEHVGWSEHLADIRSFEKLNPEGLFFLGSELVSLVEERLPERFGGDLTDYQFVEREDERGFTRLEILVHPRLGTIDHAALQEYVTAALRAESWFTTQVWATTNVLRVRRAAPLMTKAGKLLPLHHLRPDGSVPGSDRP